MVASIVKIVAWSILALFGAYLVSFREVLSDQAQVPSNFKFATAGLLMQCLLFSAMAVAEALSLVRFCIEIQRLRANGWNLNYKMLAFGLPIDTRSLRTIGARSNVARHDASDIEILRSLVSQAIDSRRRKRA